MDTLYTQNHVRTYTIEPSFRYDPLAYSEYYAGMMRPFSGQLRVRRDGIVFDKQGNEANNAANMPQWGEVPYLHVYAFLALDHAKVFFLNRFRACKRVTITCSISMYKDEASGEDITEYIATLAGSNGSLPTDTEAEIAEARMRTGFEEAMLHIATFYQEAIDRFDHCASFPSPQKEYEYERMMAPHKRPVKLPRGPLDVPLVQIANQTRENNAMVLFEDNPAAENRASSSSEMDAVAQAFTGHIPIDPGLTNSTLKTAQKTPGISEAADQVDMPEGDHAGDMTEDEPPMDMTEDELLMEISPEDAPTELATEEPPLNMGAEQFPMDMFDEHLPVNMTADIRLMNTTEDVLSTDVTEEPPLNTMENEQFESAFDELMATRDDERYGTWH